jgi:uncharacterized protein
MPRQLAETPRLYGRCMTGVRRRDFIARGAFSAGALAFGPSFLRAALAAPAATGASPYGSLQPPNADSIMLPPGFSSRRIARGRRPVAATPYRWHLFSDGQATYRTRDGGWILVSNSESLAITGAGASAIRFRPDGSISSAYRILGDTNVNCAGGPTPWGTWLSCEEWDGGQVWECDPTGELRPQPRPAMGIFAHEAAAVDPLGKRVYLTEDRDSGGFYRFAPASYPDLSVGRLEVASVNAEGAVRWRRVPDPAAISEPTRKQVPGMTQFNGGEGAFYAEGTVYFTTKGDKRVWAYDTRRSRVEVLFDRAAAQSSSLDAVDNLTVSPFGEIFVCEDGGNMEIGLITPAGEVSPFLRLVGPDHRRSELAGVVFDPSGTRMYFSSMGAYPQEPLPEVLNSKRGPGAIYEVSGPFRIPVLETGGGFGPPAGERRPRGPLAPRGRHARSIISLRAPRRLAHSSLARGLPVRVALREPGMLTLKLSAVYLPARAGDGSSTPRPRPVTLARRRLRLRRARRLRLRLDRQARSLVRSRASLEVMLIAVARTKRGRSQIVSRRVMIGRR